MMMLCRDKKSLWYKSSSVFVLKVYVHQCWRKQFPIHASDGWCLRMNGFPQIINNQCLQSTSLSLDGQGCKFKNTGNGCSEILTAIVDKQHKLVSGRTITQGRV